MFAIQHNAYSYAAMAESEAFGVSLLGAEQTHVARLFATKGKAKTRATNFDHGAALQVPLIPGALAQIECATTQVIVSGDHVIVVGLVEAARTRKGQPLLYFARQYGSFTSLESA
jgi:flavin reductase ActVB